MEAAIQKVLAHPFLLTLGLRYYIVLIINQSGKIVWVHNTDNTHYYNDAVQFILNRPVYDFYSVTKEKLAERFRDKRTIDSSGLTRLSESASFKSLNVFENQFEDYNFTTRLSLSDIHLIKISSTYLLGIISFNDTIKNFLRWQHDWKNDINILVDRNDRILGYDGKFLETTGINGNVLGKPLSEFLNMDFRKRPEKLNEKLSSPVVIYEKRRHTLSAEGNPAPVFLEIVRLNLEKYNYKIELTALCRTGEPPLCILNAAEPVPGIFPDAYGLTLAPLKVEDGFISFILKWGGEIVATYDKISFKKDKIINYTVIKYSRIIEFHVNGQLLGTYSYDILPQKPGNDFVAFGCRASQASDLSDMRIIRYTKPARAQSRPHALTAFLKNPGELFHVHSFYYPHGGSNIGLNYLRLEDLSAREKISRLAEEHKKQREEIDRLKKGLLQKTGLDRIIGNSPAMIKVKTALKMAAQSDATVMLTGQTGTGKSLVAEAVHEAGPRQSGPFVKVDCTSLPETLIESELFGFIKGAFTGAYADTVGKFEQANGGTLFLDEIGNIPAAVQAKLLSVLQDRKVQRLGSSKVINVDIRIISATNADLEKLIKTGDFRSDLYYRLNVIQLQLPALHQMTEDIPLFCDYFLTNEFTRYSHSVKTVSRSSYEKLMVYHWPGNIRELYNVLLKSIMFCEDKTLKPEHLLLPESHGTGKIYKRKMRLSLDKIVSEIKACHGNIRWAANNLGLARFTLYNRLKKAGINLKELRASA
jgi:DNA-binding NtrC family response regulator